MSQPRHPKPNILTIVLLTSVTLRLAIILHGQQRLKNSQRMRSAVDEFRWNHGSFRANRSFSRRWEQELKELGLDQSSLDQENDANVDKVHLEAEQTVIATAFSSNHYLDGRAMLETVKDFAEKFNQKPLVYLYDLGLNEDMINILQRDFGHFIKIRKFAFHRYPSYVSSLTQFRWKPLIIAELFATTEHTNFWWFDSSLRIRYDGDLRWYCNDYIESGGDETVLYPLVMPHYTSHSIFAATDPKIYDFFPIPEAAAKKTNMYGATVFAVFRRHSVKRDILKWWVLCALEEECMAPAGSSIFCAFAPHPFRDTVYAGCHRYDQSALNILVASANKFDTRRYFRDKPKGAIQVERTQ